MQPPIRHGRKFDGRVKWVEQRPADSTGVAPDLGSGRRSLILAVILAGVLIRFAAMAALHAWRFPPDQDHFAFGYETGRLARSLAMGQGYASPMPDPSGPSAFLVPLYPWLLAGIFKIFGVYTETSAVVAYSVNILFFALTAVALFRLGSLLFNFNVGLLSVSMLTLYPNSIWYASHTIWDTTLLSFGIVALVLWLLRLPVVLSTSKLLLTGFFMGLLLLLNPVPAIFYPAMIVFLRLRNKLTLSAWLRQAIIITLACALVIGPWMIRNSHVVGVFALRTGFGLNLWLGNNETAWKKGIGTYDVTRYPANFAPEARLFGELGETGYDRLCMKRGMDFIREHPDRFRQLVFDRIWSWWFGYDSGESLSATQSLRFIMVSNRFLIMLWMPLLVVGTIFAWRRHVSIGLLLSVIALYPIPYYFLIQAERYRFPLEPLSFPVIAFGLLSLLSKASRRSGPALLSR